MGTNAARNPQIYASWADVPTAAQYGTGPLWVEGVLNWCDGDKFTPGNQNAVILESIERIPPPGLPVLPMKLAGVINGLISALPNDAVNAAILYHADIFNPHIYYIDTVLGSDANAGTPAAPFATANYFLQTAANGSIGKFLNDCVIPGLDLRSTHASQATAQLKILDANGYNVTIRDPVPDLAALTWTQDGTFTNCWTATTALTGSATINSILDTSVLDYIGEPSELTRFASLALLDAATVPGFYFAANALSINDDGRNIHQSRRRYRALCMNTAGNSRIYISGAQLALKGIRCEGIYAEFAEGASRRPEFWTQDCKFRWAPSKTGNMTVAGWFIAVDTSIRYGAGDGINAFQKSTTGKGLIFTVRSDIQDTGNTRIFAVNGTFQSVSAHTGSDHIAWGSTYGGKYGNGPCVADIASTAGETDVTWMFGCQFNKIGVAVSAMIYIQGGTGKKVAYMDSCKFNGLTANAVEIIGGAQVFSYNTDVRSVLGGTIAAYNPSNPPTV